MDIFAVHLPRIMNCAVCWGYSDKRVRVPILLEPVGRAGMGQVYQHLYGGKAGSPYLFCWVREEDTRPGGWPSLEDPAPRGRGQRAGILNRGARIQRRLWLRGPKAQETLYSLLQSDGSRLADMLFFPVPREALTSLVIFCVVLCGLWALLLSGGRRNGR